VRQRNLHRCYTFLATTCSYNLFYSIYPLTTMADTTSQSASNWADTAASLLSKISGGVELTCAFDQIELQVPNAQNPNAAPATWRLNGSLRIKTRGENPAAGTSTSASAAAANSRLG